jgi:hypothetical protein
VNGETVFGPIGKEANLVYRWFRNEERRMVMAQGETLVLSSGSMPQYSRQKCMPLRYVWLRIQIGTREMETFVFSQMVELRLKL